MVENDDQYLNSYKISNNKSLILINLNYNGQNLNILLPLKFQNYDFTEADYCVELLTQEFIDLITASKRVNTIMKKSFKDCDNYINLMAI